MMTNSNGLTRLCDLCSMFLIFCGTKVDVIDTPEQAMRDVYGAGSVSLHVRQKNYAAYSFYSKTLGYK